MLRGVGAGAGSMFAAVLLVVIFAAALVGNAGWGDRAAMTGILLTLVWCLVAAGAAAVGAWQAAEGGAPSPGSALLAGALGPGALVVIVSVAALGADGPSAGVIVVEAVLEVAAAVAGAAVLVRRLEPGG